MTKDYVPVEKVIGAAEGSIYKLTILVAKRAMELAEGEKPLIEKQTEKLLDLALEEIENKKIIKAAGKKIKKPESEDKKQSESKEKAGKEK